MHPKNLHKNGYDFSALVTSKPELKSFLIKTPVGKTSIDFSNPVAVKTLNAALLARYYGVKNWDIPANFLCSPVPGRADYIHHIADLLAEDSLESSEHAVHGIDIGVGANLIYPILGSQLYGWHFVGSELSKASLDSANAIIQTNKNLSKLVTLKHQTNPLCIFNGIIKPKDQFDFTMCNPPFHANQQLAMQGSQKKNRNLARNKLKRQDKRPNRPNQNTSLNFAGQSNELWCKGGELAFIKRMISESKDYANQVKWFTSLVSKKEHLKPLFKALNEAKVDTFQTINMGQGNKISRFIAWRF